MDILKGIVTLTKRNHIDIEQITRKFMYLKFCLTVQSHLHQIQYVHMAHDFPPPFCTGKKFIQDENGKIVCSFLLLINVIALILH
jgi:hypothetical protein